MMLRSKKLISDVDTMVFILPYSLAPKIAAYKHTCPNTGSQCHTNENIRCGHRHRDRRQCGGTNKLTDDNGVSHMYTC